MDSLLLDRWQFGITTAYHFVFVPLTIGTAALTAVLQTLWLRSGREGCLRATKFWGELFLIAFALGSATGIVQEFQLGMAWSEHFRFVGDGFGAQPATEGLLAFFLESTLLGLWIVGWERLPRGVHAACIWLAALAIALSDYFVFAAGGPATHPAGGAGQRAGVPARLTRAWAELGDPARLIAFAHTVAAALLIAGALLVAGSAWHLRRDQDTETMRVSLGLGLWSVLAGGVGTAAAGVVDIRAATGGRPSYAAGPGIAHHTLAPATYSGIGAGIGFGLLAVLTALYGLWHTRAKAASGTRARFHRLAARAVPLLPIGSGVAWILTGTDRRPRAAHEVPDLAHAASPVVSGDGMWTLLTVLTLLYASLAVVEVWLIVRAARRGPATAPAWDGEAGGAEPELGFAY